MFLPVEPTLGLQLEWTGFQDLSPVSGGVLQNDLCRFLTRIEDPTLGHPKRPEAAGMPQPQPARVGPMVTATSPPDSSSPQTASSGQDHASLEALAHAVTTYHGACNRDRLLDAFAIRRVLHIQDDRKGPSLIEDPSRVLLLGDRTTGQLPPPADPDRRSTGRQTAPAAPASAAPATT